MGPRAGLKGFEGEEITSKRVIAVIFDILRQALPNGYKHSYWHDLGAERLCHLTVGQLVDNAADRWRDGEALVSVYEDQRLTFGEAREKVSLTYTMTVM
jgi:hypothetical protein